VNDPVRDEYAAIAAVYDLWSADMTADVPFYVGEAVQAGGPVLEIGVGTGRVAAAMARAGVDVIGIDVSPSMLARARQTMTEAGVEDRVTLHQADMRSFRLDRTFPLAVLPYRVFAHARTVEDQVDTLFAVRDHLDPGGRLILNVTVPHMADLTAWDGLRHEGQFTLPNGETAVLWRQAEYEPGTQQLTFHFVVDHLGEGGEVTRRVHGASTVRQTTPGEVDHALARAGFTVQDRWGWFDRRPLGPHATEYVVSATRGDRWSRGGGGVP
jgi:SAM-dependent methyltransferase